ncbi:MAG: heme exporter protein CcmB [Chloroflexota bacterium]|nr:heme exporter protein CcmB [Chloroflexota bacterium]
MISSSEPTTPWPLNLEVATYFESLRTLIWKEMIAEWRSREALSAMFFFSVTSLLIFNFALDLSPVSAQDVVPGILWVTFLFASLLGLNRSFQREKEQSSIEGLMLAPVGRSAIYVAKMVGNFLFLLVIELVALPVMVALFNVALPLSILPVLLLGTLGLSAAGTIFAAMAINTRLRDVLLPLMLLPVVVPLLVGSVQATGAVMGGNSLLGSASSSILLIVAFDVIFLTLPSLLFEYVLEE